jgi:hypothetical protein
MVLAPALESVKLSAGVVVEVAVEVVNSGERLPAEKEVTVPDPPLAEPPSPTTQFVPLQKARTV